MSNGKGSGYEYLSLPQVEDRPLTLGDDGRADSPGHSAKYSTYTTMELEANVVIGLQLVQVMYNYCSSVLDAKCNGLQNGLLAFDAEELKLWYLGYKV